MVFDNRDSTKIRNYMNSNKRMEQSYLDRVSAINSDEVEEKRLEIRALGDKYSLDNTTINRLARFYLLNNELSCGNIVRTTDFVAYILKEVYGYTDENISNFLNRNTIIMLASYSDFRARLGIFNHIGLLEEVLFKGSSYLGYEFSQSHFGTYSLYAIIAGYNIDNLETLRETIERTSQETLNKLREKFPLSHDIIKEFDEELRKKLNKEVFKMQLKQRMNNKKLR